MAIMTVPRVLVSFYCLLFMVCTGVIAGVIISPCDEDNIAEVVEGKTDNIFHCANLTDKGQVDWRVVNKSIDYPAGSCPAVSAGGYNCTEGGFGSAFLVSRLSNTESKLVMDTTALDKSLYEQFGMLKCKDQTQVASCQIDYIVPIEGECTVQTGTGWSGFPLYGKCTLRPGARSSRGRFQCVWTRHGAEPQKIDLTENSYQTECVLKTELPQNPGSYTYTVNLFPGQVSLTAGTVHVATPKAPTVTGCGGGGEAFVPANTTVTCTCNSESLGQPAGRLLWARVGDNSTATEGNYGDSSLTVSETVLRTDHPSVQFRCSVEWMREVPAETFISVNVGYPPSQVTLSINQSRENHTVDEHQSVTFSCQSSESRPVSNVTLEAKGSNSVLVRQTTVLSHVVVGRCEDSGQYVCTADNGMGPMVISTPLWLFVRCFPRGRYDVGEVNFIHDPVSVTFIVTAHPVPSHVSFHYLGASETGAADVTDINDTLIQLTGECRFDPGADHRALCTVIVSWVSGETAAGFYRVTVTNTQGSGRFRLRVLYRAQTKSDASFTVGLVGACVALGVALIVIVIILIWQCRRHRERSSGADAENRTESTAQPVALYHDYMDLVPESPGLPPDDVGDYAICGAQAAAVDHDYLEPIPGPAELAGPYECLQMEDLQQRSQYCGISRVKVHGYMNAAQRK